MNATIHKLTAIRDQLRTSDVQDEVMLAAILSTIIAAASAGHLMDLGTVVATFNQQQLAKIRAAIGAIEN